MRGRRRRRREKKEKKAEEAHLLHLPPPLLTCCGALHEQHVNSMHVFTQGVRHVGQVEIVRVVEAYHFEALVACICKKTQLNNGLCGDRRKEPGGVFRWHLTMPLHHDFTCSCPDSVEVKNPQTDQPLLGELWSLPPWGNPSYRRSLERGVEVDGSPRGVRTTAPPEVAGLLLGASGRPWGASPGLSRGLRSVARNPSLKYP